MKSTKMIPVLIVVLLFMITARITAQTYQYQWTNSFPDGSGSDNPGMCLNHEIKGFYTYHVAIHVDPQTGLVDNVKNNVLHYDLTDVVTGKKLILQDTGHDAYNIGGNWYFWSWVTGANLPIGTPPAEGTMVWATFKFISPGGVKVTMREVFQLHMNASGEVVVETDKTVIDCN